jgi:Glycosyl transferase family 2
VPWGDPPATVLQPGDSPGHPLAPWFAHKRGEHEPRRAAARARGIRPRRRAVVTMVHDEAVFLPVWLGYYARFFAPEDIYVLDNDSTDGSTEGGGFVRILAPHDRVDWAWMLETVEGLQHELLAGYDAVLVSDVDELVVPSPRLGTLGDYLDAFDEDFVNCLGYELIHMRDREPPLRLDAPIMGQRRFWFFNDAYDKPLLARVPMQWRMGFHGRADFEFNFDPDLRLVHLHRVDYELCRARHRLRSERAWHPRDVEQAFGTHNRITADEQFERWFYEDSGVDGVTVAPEEIPPAWRGAF